MIPPQILEALAVANHIRLHPDKAIAALDTGVGRGRCACGKTISLNKPMCLACRTQLEQEVACK